MKVIGAGLNKTGTKTMRAFCLEWGLSHRTYDLDAFNKFRSGRIEDLLDEMEQDDSFEDWPWPLMFREIDERFPDARFVLTVRRSPEAWYRSLCKMAVRMGPMNDFEKHIYGYSMPHGRREEHIAFYNAHNEAVEAHFADRPDKLIRICWEEGDDGARLASFLGMPTPTAPARHENVGASVYGGDNLMLAHVNRVMFQAKWNAKRRVGRVVNAIKRRTAAGS